MKNAMLFIASLFFCMATSAATWQVSDIKTGVEGNFGHLPGGGSADPNSFKTSGVGDSLYMTLWGADGFNITGTGIDAYNNSIIGMDFRVELSQVPLPAAFWLFAPVIIGFAGLLYQTKK